ISDFTSLNQCLMCCCFVCVLEKRPTLHHPPGCEGPHVCAAFLVPHSCLISRRAQELLPAQNDPAVSNCNDPPSALQQSVREAGGDPDSTGRLLPAAELEPATGQPAGRYAELGG
ncbi:hypothetical protein M9458_032826, partial [Cirrhinus mrigala]